jgi:IS5 family transposase
MKKRCVEVDLKDHKSCNELFLAQLQSAAPWPGLTHPVTRQEPSVNTDCPPLSRGTLQCIQYLQHWLMPSHLGLADAFFDTPLYREFAQLEVFASLPYEGTLLRYCCRMEKYGLAEQVWGALNGILIQHGLSTKTQKFDRSFGGIR